jgi:hypothetical protein
MRLEKIKTYVLVIAVVAIILMGLYKLNISIEADRDYMDLAIIIAIQFFILIGSVAFLIEIFKEIFFWQKVRMRQIGWSNYLLDSIKSIVNAIYNVFVLLSVVFILIAYGNYYFWAALPLMLLFSAILLEAWLQDNFRIGGIFLNFLNKVLNFPTYFFSFIKIGRDATKLILFFVGFAYVFNSANFLLNIGKFTKCVNKNGIEYVNECYRKKSDWVMLLRDSDE